MSTALKVISNKLSARFGMGDNTDEVIDILKNTAFKGGTQVTDAQMTALMIVSDQYGLNPWTREIYAFPDKGGIVPVVGVDGWSRIINEHPQFDGLEFVQDDSSCTCVMYRKDRSHPVKVTEYLDECLRPPMNGRNGPWQSHPKRMLRHKALIQCSRLAFGFVGIYDQDEAERIVEREINPIDPIVNNESKTNTVLNNLNKKTVIEHEPVVLLIEVLKAIELANNKETLDHAKSLMFKLVADEDKDDADSAYRAKVRELKARFEKPVTTDWGAAIEQCISKKELLALSDSMPHDVYEEFEMAIDMKHDFFR